MACALCVSVLLLFSCPKANRQSGTAAQSGSQQPGAAAAAPQQTQNAGSTEQAIPIGNASRSQATTAEQPAAQGNAAGQPAGKGPAGGQPATTAAAAQAQQPGQPNPAQGGIPLFSTTTGEHPPETPQSYSNASTLMALGRDKRILPEDFKIGPLTDDLGAANDQAQAIATAKAFLASIVKGALDEKLIAPESQTSVADNLSFGLKQGYVPTSYRLGAPKSQDNGELAATVRLFSAEGSAEGEIYMGRTGTQWLVADVQISLAQLAVKRPPSKEKFFPSTYRWLLEGN